jgi:TolB-like protein
LYRPARCAPAGLPLAAWSSRARLRASARRALALLLLVGGALGVAASSALAQAGPSEAQRPIVAVLPFEVHSAKPIDYLGVSLANLLRARLEAGGEVLVLSAEEVASRVARPPAPGESDAALRAVAREIGADALVSGSLTELAGHFSLDVKLVPAAEGSRPQSFVLTADREEDLLARTNEVADAVVARTTAAAAASVVRIRTSSRTGVAVRRASRRRTSAGTGTRRPGW